MLKFIRVTKSYQPEKKALDNVSFDIDLGELVLITGKSGSGKTTLLKLITKEQDPSEGEIYFKQENINELRRSKVPYHRRKIGAVFQDYKLLPELNIWENIALALSILGHRNNEIEEKVTDLLKLVDLTDKAYLFPHQLSGGEAQRISIARALSTAPELIFADEPTGNLDAENSLIIARLLKKINELGTTVIITTHDKVVIDALKDARQMSLEDGVLTDSKALEKSKKKDDDTETDDDADEETKEDDSNEKDTKPVKKKTGFGFFGIFSRKVETDESDTEDDDEPVEVKKEDLDDRDEKDEEPKDKKKQKKQDSKKDDDSDTKKKKNASSKKKETKKVKEDK